MTSDNHHSESILPSLAAHESDLLAKVEASKTEAREIIEKAHAEAQKHLRAEDARLAADSAKIRREREDVRQKAFEATIGAAEQKLVGVRAEAARRAPDVAKKVLALFSPAHAKGTSV